MQKSFFSIWYGERANLETIKVFEKCSNPDSIDTYIEFTKLLEARDVNNADY